MNLYARIQISKTVNFIHALKYIQLLSDLWLI